MIPRENKLLIISWKINLWIKSKVYIPTPMKIKKDKCLIKTLQWKEENDRLRLIPHHGYGERDAKLKRGQQNGQNEAVEIRFTQFLEAEAS